MSLVAASHWGADLIISLTTLSMVKALGAGGTFLLFAAINAVAFVFVLRYVPETRGRSLEELEASLRNGALRLWIARLHTRNRHIRFFLGYERRCGTAICKPDSRSNLIERPLWPADASFMKEKPKFCSRA